VADIVVIPTMHTLQQSSEVVAAAAVADSDAPEVDAAVWYRRLPVLVFVLAAVVVAAVVDPRLYRLYERRQNG